MCDALEYLCNGYVLQREKELAEADLYDPDPSIVGSILNPQVMRLRAKAAVWQAVIRDLKDVIHDPIYRQVVSPEGSED
jgi:hypothetical protein